MNGSSSTVRIYSRQSSTRVSRIFLLDTVIGSRVLLFFLFDYTEQQQQINSMLFGFAFLFSTSRLLEIFDGSTTDPNRDRESH